MFIRRCPSCGLALALLIGVPKDTYSQKSAQIIVIVNLIVLAGLFLLGYCQIFFFAEIRHFYQISFLLFGYYLYLLILCLRKGEPL